mmetsp:Transcript_25680/g.64576  ORF Transcript_25680/g.64576 Transcript_25680/m.64576 type:complete len:268 (+) Transcript_25680:1047-1850(+)
MSKHQMERGIKKIVKRGIVYHTPHTTCHRKRKGGRERKEERKKKMSSFFALLSLFPLSLRKPLETDHFFDPTNRGMQIWQGHTSQSRNFLLDLFERCVLVAEKHLGDPLFFPFSDRLLVQTRRQAVSPSAPVSITGTGYVKLSIYFLGNLCPRYPFSGIMKGIDFLDQQRVHFCGPCRGLQGCFFPSIFFLELCPTSLSSLDGSTFKICFHLPPSLPCFLGFFQFSIFFFSPFSFCSEIENMFRWISPLLMRQGLSFARQIRIKTTK